MLNDFVRSYVMVEGHVGDKSKVLLHFIANDCFLFEVDEGQTHFVDKNIALH